MRRTTATARRVHCRRRPLAAICTALVVVALRRCVHATAARRRLARRQRMQRRQWPTTATMARGRAPTTTSRGRIDADPPPTARLVVAASITVMCSDAATSSEHAQRHWTSARPPHRGEKTAAVDSSSQRTPILLGKLPSWLGASVCIAPQHQLFSILLTCHRPLLAADRRPSPTHARAFQTVLLRLTDSNIHFSLPIFTSTTRFTALLRSARVFILHQ